MTRERMLLIGVVLILLGVQFRRVQSYTFNQTVSQIVQKQMQKRSLMSSFTPDASSYDSGLSSFPTMPAPLISVSPPRWLGFSFVSVGAVLILTCPCFKT